MGKGIAVACIWAAPAFGIWVTSVPDIGFAWILSCWATCNVFNGDE